jgi:hypothetical protein
MIPRATWLALLSGVLNGLLYWVRVQLEVEEKRVKVPDYSVN